MSRQPRSRTLYVRNLTNGIRHDDLHRLFSKCGRIIDVTIPVDYYTGRLKGFAFVEFEDYRDAEDAYNRLNWSRLMGREIELEFARGYRKTPAEMSIERGDYESDRRRRKSYSRSRSPRRDKRGRDDRGSRRRHSSSRSASPRSRSGSRKRSSKKSRKEKSASREGRNKVESKSRSSRSKKDSSREKKSYSKSPHDNVKEESGSHSPHESNGKAHKRSEKGSARHSKSHRSPSAHSAAGSDQSIHRDGSKSHSGSPYESRNVISPVDDHSPYLSDHSLEGHDNNRADSKSLYSDRSRSRSRSH